MAALHFRVSEPGRPWFCSEFRLCGKTRDHVVFLWLRPPPPLRPLHPLLCRLPQAAAADAEWSKTAMVMFRDETDRGGEFSAGGLLFVDLL